jgi:hypothetical protein
LAEGLNISKPQGLTPIACNSLYENLQSLYNKHNYLPDHKWNCDEIGIQAGKQYGARFFAKRRSQRVYNIIPKSREWMTIIYVVNVVGGVLPSFYIFKGERIRKDYIQQCKPRSYMAIKKKTWMACYFFKQIFFFFFFFLSFFLYLIDNKKFVSTE